jgi:hypothetical protein
MVETRQLFKKRRTPKKKERLILLLKRVILDLKNLKKDSLNRIFENGWGLGIGDKIE